MADYIKEYGDTLRNGKIPANKDLFLALDLVDRKLSDPDVIYDRDKTERAKGLIEKYFSISPFARSVLSLS